MTLDLVLDGSLGLSPEGDQYIAIPGGKRLPVTPEEHLQFTVGLGPWTNKYKHQDTDL